MTVLEITVLPMDGLAVTMSPLHALAIAAAGLVAGTINTVVGSGTLVTFPVLLALGYPPLVANVSNTIGLVAGSLSGVHAYRSELAQRVHRLRALRLGACSLVGGVIGSLLLFAFPGSTFRKVVPFLILAACALMALQPAISRWLAKQPAARDMGLPGAGRGPAQRGQPPRSPILLGAIVLMTAVYGGYFGAAQGVILISVLAIFLADSLHSLNALKNVLAMLANLAAGVVFAFSGKVSWAVSGVMAVGAIVGGQLGGRLGRRLPPRVLRVVVVGVGTVVAVLLLA